jgi:ribulose-phosphate 3-epimerase
MAWKDWARTVEVEPSLYASDFSRLGEQIESLARAGVRVFHFDVGDGHFVPPITVGPIVLQSISPIVHRLGAVLDCHLMVEQPEKHFEAVAEAGGDSVTVHFEACEDLPAVYRRARELELGVGLAFNPATSPADAAGAADEVDLVLCMSINPGYSGQQFMPETIGRINELRQLLDEDMHIQVDGGIGPDNIRDVRDAGADLFVAGTSIFGQNDIARAYQQLVQALQ